MGRVGFGLGYWAAARGLKVNRRPNILGCIVHSCVYKGQIVVYGGMTASDSKTHRLAEIMYIQDNWCQTAMVTILEFEGM